MSYKLKFYTIAFETLEGEVLNNSVSDFLHTLNEKLNNNIEQIRKEVHNKKMRLFSIIYDYKTLNQFVIPFGKLKNNISYKEDNNAKELTVVDLDIYDVNLMYFDEQHKILMLTQDKYGPSYKNIEAYLNLFIEPNERRHIKINPIYINDDIEKIRNAKRVNKINIKFDFSKGTQDYINKRLETQGDKISFLSAVNKIARSSKDIDAKNLQLSLSAGNKKLDIKSLIAFLDSFNIQDEYIKEIEVYYSNGETEKTTPAKLKNSNIVLFDCISGESSITYRCLLEKNTLDNESKAQKIIQKNINKFHHVVRKYYS